jgi:hypothetical protein
MTSDRSTESTEHVNVYLRSGRVLRVHIASSVASGLLVTDDCETAAEVVAEVRRVVEAGELDFKEDGRDAPRRGIVVGPVDAYLYGT